ncbi:GntR family transcriptional regulator [Microbacterium resistens]|uniref:GntR family transcriptional regulator n=1 Tax=Microbacterium resistens TaxID=156977 RepID=UPI00082C3A35|nr:GntR family transcriptional regulator [Microbacterium resistens]
MAKRDSVVRGVVSALRQLIDESYAVGDRLPNEKQLAESLDVSRGSLREALGALETEGFVTRTWGVGTFVSVPRRSSSLSMSAIASYRDRVRAVGRTVVLREAAVDLVGAPPEAAAALNVEPGAEVWRVLRLFAVDGTPSAQMIEYIPTSIRGVAIDPSPMTTLDSGLFDMLDRHVAGVVAHTTTDIEAFRVAEPEAAALDVEAGTPVLRTEQVTSDDEGAVLAYGITLQRTDVLRMRITR